MSEQPVLKDEEREHPVPSEWRRTFRAIVSAFVDGDFKLSRGVDGVDDVSDDTAKQIEEYVAEYGETLVELPDDTWTTSVAQWLGTRWDVLVDLWTEGEGRSDLVLHARVFEANGDYRYEVHLVYVP